MPIESWWLPEVLVGPPLSPMVEEDAGELALVTLAVLAACPYCSGPHTLSQCKFWKIPRGVA